MFLKPISALIYLLALSAHAGTDHHDVPVYQIPLFHLLSREQQGFYFIRCGGCLVAVEVTSGEVGF